MIAYYKYYVLSYYKSKDQLTDNIVSNTGPVPGTVLQPVDWGWGVLHIIVSMLPGYVSRQSQ